MFIFFFIPTLVDATIGLVDSSSNISSCWKMGSNITLNTEARYVPVDDEENVSIIPGADSYEQGVEQVHKASSLVYYNQGSYSSVPFCSGGNTVANSGCGAASFAMAASTFSNPSYNPAVVGSWFCQNYSSLANGGLNEDAVTTSATLSHFGLKGEVLFDKTGRGSYNYGTSYNPSEGNAMLKAVQSGKSVMFGMPGHWSILGPNPACSANQFYLYNPGRVTSNGCYTPEALFQYTYNYSNRCTNTGWCGWDVAIALYS